MTIIRAADAGELDHIRSPLGRLFPIEAVHAWKGEREARRRLR